MFHNELSVSSGKPQQHHNDFFFFVWGCPGSCRLQNIYETFTKRLQHVRKHLRNAHEARPAISSCFWTNICHPKQENPDQNPLMKLNQCGNTNTLTHKHSDFTWHSARGCDTQNCSDGTNIISNDKKGSAQATSSMTGQPPWQQGVPTTPCLCSFVFSTDAMDALDALH